VAPVAELSYTLYEHKDMSVPLGRTASERHPMTLTTPSSPDLATVSPLQRAALTTPTVLWNDSADPEELAQSIAFGAVGATCNPVIAYATISKHVAEWAPRLREIADENPTFGESEIGWRAVELLSIDAAALLEPIFREQGGRNGRLSIQTDPRLHRDAAALVEQAVHFDSLAPNIIVKIPATKTGIAAIEEATYRGVSITTSRAWARSSRSWAAASTTG
jgi:transaldolase